LSYQTQTGNITLIKIVTDSTCDMPADWIQRYRVNVVPVNIHFDLDSFQEGVNLTPAQFYDRINRSGSLPTTSQPAVGEFKKIFERLSADGSEILSLHLTSKLSGTWQAATLAARQLNTQAKITVFDSWTGSAGLGFMVREAAQMAKAGQAVPQIIDKLRTRREQIKIHLLLKDLRYARLSGRVGRIREILAALLKVKPIIGVEQGALTLVERTRGQKRADKRLLDLTEQSVGQSPVHIAVAHALDESRGSSLLAEATARLNSCDTYVTDLALSIAVHFGPGTVGLVAYPAD
jgi:DegV family protein with EDD domain